MGNILSRRSCLANNWFVWDFSWTSFSFLLGRKVGVEVMTSHNITEIGATVLSGFMVILLFSLIGLLVWAVIQTWGLVGFVLFFGVFIGLGYLSYLIGKLIFGGY